MEGIALVGRTEGGRKKSGEVWMRAVGECRRGRGRQQ